MGFLFVVRRREAGVAVSGEVFLVVVGERGEGEVKEVFHIEGRGRGREEEGRFFL